MKLNSPTGASQTQAWGTQAAPGAHTAGSGADGAEKTTVFGRGTDVVDLSSFMSDADAEKLSLLEQFAKNLAATESVAKPVSQPPKDGLGQLTQRLVAAVEPTEVRFVLGEAERALAGYRAARASVEQKDRAKVDALIKKAQKLVDRCVRKLSDLGRETELRTRQQKAGAARQKARAEELKDELRRQMAERKQRERGYLHEEAMDKLSDAQAEAAQPPGKGPKLDAATEAKIEAQAQAMAAAEAASSGGEAAAADTGGADVAATGGGGAPAGGEAAAAEGGGAAAE